MAIEDDQGNSIRPAILMLLRLTEAALRNRNLSIVLAWEGAAVRRRELNDAFSVFRLSGSDRPPELRPE